MANGLLRESGAQHRASEKRLECGVHGALTIKNIFAAVGLVVVAKAGWGFYCKYRKLEQENAFWRDAAERGNVPRQT